jgi:hypothetical protein
MLAASRREILLERAAIAVAGKLADHSPDAIFLYLPPRGAMFVMRRGKLRPDAAIVAVIG